MDSGQISFHAVSSDTPPAIVRLKMMYTACGIPIDDFRETATSQASSTTGTTNNASTLN